MVTKSVKLVRKVRDYDGRIYGKGKLGAWSGREKE